MKCRPDFQVALILVRHEVEGGELPGGTDLAQAVLDGQLFGRSVGDVLDLVRVLVEAPVDDPFQGEVLRLVVELATGLCLPQRNVTVVVCGARYNVSINSKKRLKSHDFFAFSKT